MIGRTIGNYRITGVLGSGGIGEVFIGEDLMLERQVAIKLLRPELASRPDVVARFRVEAVTLAKLHHTNIATVYTFFQEGTNFFLVMEYVQGWTLQHVIEAHGALDTAVALGLFRQTLDGIGFAHQRNIIHRDLKPSNVMLTDTGSIKVMDFGLARVLGSTHLTRVGHLVGTLEYISPEQIRGEETDRRSDIYSLGVLLYELITGHLPFETHSEYELIRAQVETPPRPPHHVMPDVSPELERSILRALAKAPEERFQSVEEFSHALAGCLRKTAPREALAAILIPLQVHTLKSHAHATQCASQPVAIPAESKATRLAAPIDRHTITPPLSYSSQLWKNARLPLLVLATAAAVAGGLLFLGTPHTALNTPREPGLSIKPPAAVVSPLSQDTFSPKPQETTSLPDSAPTWLNLPLLPDVAPPTDSAPIPVVEHPPDGAAPPPAQDAPPSTLPDRSEDEPSAQSQPLLEGKDQPSLDAQPVTESATSAAGATSALMPPAARTPKIGLPPSPRVDDWQPPAAPPLTDAAPSVPIHRSPTVSARKPPPTKQQPVEDKHYQKQPERGSGWVIKR